MLTLGAKDLFLLIPEGAKAPENLSKNITPLSLPLQNTYVVSTAAMDPIRQVGGLTGVGYTGTRANGWHVKGSKLPLSTIRRRLRRSWNPWAFR